MSLIVAVQMDPIERIKIVGDSTFGLLLEAQARSHSLLYYTPDRLSLDGDDTVWVTDLDHAQPAANAALLAWDAVVSIGIIWLMLSKKGRTILSPEYAAVVAATPEIASAIPGWIRLVVLIVWAGRTAIGLAAYV